MNQPVSGEGPPPGRISYEEAAELLDIGLDDVSELVAAGTLPADAERREAARSDVLVLRWMRRDHDERENDPSAPPDWESEWLNPREAARLLGISEQSVTRRLRERELPGVQRLGRWWIRTDDLLSGR